jgi:hypothetical protein
LHEFRGIYLIQRMKSSSALPLALDVRIGTGKVLLVAGCSGALLWRAEQRAWF